MLAQSLDSIQINLILFDSLTIRLKGPLTNFTHSCHDYQPPKIYIFIYRYICICHTCNIHFSCLYLIYTDISYFCIMRMIIQPTLVAKVYKNIFLIFTNHSLSTVNKKRHAIGLYILICKLQHKTLSFSLCTLVLSRFIEYFGSKLYIIFHIEKYQVIVSIMDISFTLFFLL